MEQDAEEEEEKEAEGTEEDGVGVDEEAEEAKEEAGAVDEEEEGALEVKEWPLATCSCKLTRGNCGRGGTDVEDGERMETPKWGNPVEEQRRQ